MLYRITWGDESRVVNADNERDAWCEFVRLSEAATKCPNANKRTIEALPEPEAVEVVAPPAEPEAVEDPEPLYVPDEPKAAKGKGRK